MPEFECDRARTVIDRELIVAANRESAARKFRAIHGAYPDFVGDDEVLAVCGRCEKVIFDEEDYDCDDEEIAICATCAAIE